MSPDSGELRCRVTTVTRRWVDGSNAADLIAGFDQEAAAVFMARLASFKMEQVGHVTGTTPTNHP